MASGGTIATRYIQIVPSAEGIKGSISGLIGGEAESAGTAAGTGIGSKLVGALKVAVVAAGVGKLIKESLMAGADVQQSFGGLETIYGKAADAAKAHAKEAAQYGIDMNTYAEQAVGMGAALKQAFGGDTVKAAKSADTAIKDMADNAAKMGSDVGSLQMAYAGFAKQNYTMLDNLKLGYGGTKQEMQRLLQDAEKLSGVKYDINNLGDVYDAIHVIQEDLGLTGVAAMEASTTFSGSFEAMKASATNFLAELSTGGDVVGALTTLVESAVTFLVDNALPMVLEVVSGFVPAVVTVIQEMGPDMIQSGLDMINNLASGISEAIPMILEYAGQLLADFSEYLKNNAGSILEAGINLIVNIVEGLAEGIPKLIQYVPTILSNIVATITENLPTIVKAGVDILLSIIEGIIKTIASLIAAIPEVVSAIWDTLMETDWNQLGSDILTYIKDGFVSLVNDLVEEAETLVSDVVEKFTDFDWAGLGSSIISGIKDGIDNFKSSVVDSASSVASSIYSKFKGFFNIKSPSRLMRNEIGKNITLGMALGIEDEAGSVEDAIGTLSNRSVDALGNIDMIGTSGEANVAELLATWLPKLANMSVVLDSGTLVGEMTDGIDNAIGRKATLRARGAY